VAGSLLRADPAAETAALAKARAAQHGHQAEQLESGESETGSTVATSHEDPSKKL
jgi:ubiquinol-cytochrome c reductase cytochrome b subunit